MLEIVDFGTWVHFTPKSEDIGISKAILKKLNAIAESYKCSLHFDSHEMEYSIGTPYKCFAKAKITEMIQKIESVVETELTFEIHTVKHRMCKNYTLEEFKSDFDNDADCGYDTDM